VSIRFGRAITDPESVEVEEVRRAVEALQMGEETLSG
jgi:hypothetical protein